MRLSPLSFLALVGLVSALPQEVTNVPDGNITAVSRIAHSPGAPSINDKNFQNIILNTHNNLRAHHGAPRLVWDNKLAVYAQNWANGCFFEKDGTGHSRGPYGENLHTEFLTPVPKDSYRASFNSANTINNGWYGNEEKLYDYNHPHYDHTWGHFTQVVWKDTRRIGCAWTTDVCVIDREGKKMRLWKLVCEYDPPGNYVDRFAKQVGRRH